MVDDTGMNPDFWEKVLETSPIGICVLDSEGYFVFANTRACDIVGLRLDEITKRYHHSPDWNVTDLEGEPIAQGKLPFDLVKESGKPLTHVRIVVQRPDRTRIVLSVSASPLFDEAGDFDGLIAAYEDVTQKVKLEALSEQAKRLEAIMASMPIGIQLTDADGRNVYANRRAQEILGLGFDEITRRFSHSPEWRLSDLDGNPLKAEDRVFARVKEGLQPLYDQKIMVQRPDENWIAISVNAQPLFDESGRFDGLAAVYEDITSRVLLERELEQHREQLEQKVRQRTHRLEELNQVYQQEILLRWEREEELEAARERLQALSAFVQSAREREKSRSAFRVHDEIGQNLTVLKMAIKGLERKYIPQSEASHALDDIYAVLKQLQGQVYNISAELRPAILDDVGLGAALEWQAQDFQDKTGIVCVVEQSMDESTIDLEVSTGVFRIFQELLDNLALRPGIGRIDVRLSLEGERLVLEAGSDRAAIVQDDLQRADPLSYIYMREYARRFDGDLGIIRAEGEGAKVVLRVPLAGADRK